MSNTRVFLDSNVVLYLLSADAVKANKAEATMAGNAFISVQVLNEVANVLLKKFKFSFAEIDDFLTLVKAVCTVVPVTLAVHESGWELAQRHNFSLYDAMIVAAALNTDCEILFTEDMQNGLVVHKVLKLVNPFQ